VHALGDAVARGDVEALVSKVSPRPMVAIT
jgi:hypothetical protein